MPDAGAAAPEPQGRGFASPLVPLFLTVLVDVLALSIMLPLLPFLATKFGASPLVTDMLFACFALAQFISGPILGQLSDRFGRKPVLLASQLGTFVGLLVIGFAESLTLLFIARIIDGLTAGNLSIAQAYITDVTKPENRTKAFGLIGVAFAVGFLIGPAASGLLAKYVSMSAPPLLAAGLSGLSVILTYTLLPARTPPQHDGPRPTRSATFSRYMRQGATRGRLLEMFAFIWSFSTLTSGLALMLAKRFHYDVAEVAYLFVFSGVIGGASQGGLGRAAKRLGEVKLSAVGLGLMVIGYVILAYGESLPLLLVALGIGGIGSSVVRPALTTLLTETVPKAEHGLALGINQAMGSVAMTFAPLLGGFLIDRGLLAAWGLVAAGFAVVPLVLRTFE